MLRDVSFRSRGRRNAPKKVAFIQIAETEWERSRY
jgi:hypothetical protein